MPGNPVDLNIRQYLPFGKPSEAWSRIAELEAENKRIVGIMLRVSESFKQSIAEPREIYLAVQEVRSRTVYIRWRKKGVNGKQSYLLLNSVAGREFLLRQPERARKLYKRYDRWSLQLNLAHSLRLNEIKRIRQYLDNL